MNSIYPPQQPPRFATTERVSSRPATIPERILITGGAGFVGCNLSASLLRDGHTVTVFDSLARKGSEKNLAWLHSLVEPGQFDFIQGDVRDAGHVAEVTANADVIFHLAAQVAVTSSVDDPRTDFESNALGTFNVLEGARFSKRRPILIITSTNKVYGGMEEISVVKRPTRYEYEDRPFGVSESQPLDFHSPYGCSKGTADQYVRDYSRIYGLRTVVFRMSCIYGPHQFGNEDQGWVAHFIIAAMAGRPITIFGDGKQVRDILFVDDLVRAFRIAVDRISVTAGQVFNIGGGPDNTLSVWDEFGKLLRKFKGEEITVQFRNWRPGDQPCYISDIRKAAHVMGWKPEVDKEAGIGRLWDWVAANQQLFGAPTEVPVSARRPSSRNRRVAAAVSLEKEAV